MDVSDALGAFHGSPFVAGLAPSERRRLGALAVRRTAGPGDVLLHEGAPTTVLGIITQGRVALRLQVPGRGAITILTVEPGDVFGWSALVPPYRSTSTIVAVEPTEAIVFDAVALRAALEEDDGLAASLYPRILRSVSRRLEATRMQLLDVFGRDPDTAW
jgi:CRP/FNR family cyclic AMP-dependent transcriptional regulator